MPNEIWSITMLSSAYQMYLATAATSTQLDSYSSNILPSLTNSFISNNTAENYPQQHSQQCRQKDSKELRFKSHNDLLATYDTDNNPLRKKESEKKAYAVQNIIHSKQYTKCGETNNIKRAPEPYDPTKSRTVQVSN
jgi:CRISPR/Cas system-associated protein Cas5 (RAMP superfamily)